MAHRSRTPLMVVALLALGAASDMLGGIWTSALNVVLSFVVLAGALALPAMLWALAVGVLGAGGARRAR